MELLFFNLRVEIWQVLLAAGTIGLLRQLQRFGAEWFADARHVAVLRTLAAHAVRALAVFWLIERGAAF